MKRKDSKKKTRRYGVCNDGRERSKTKMVGKSHGYGCSWSEAVSTSQVAWCPYKEFDHESGLILVCSKELEELLCFLGRTGPNQFIFKMEGKKALILNAPAVSEEVFELVGREKPGGIHCRRPS